MASIPLVEGRHALRGEKPNRSTLKQGCGGCRDRSEFKNRTEQTYTRPALNRILGRVYIDRITHYEHASRVARSLQVAP